MNLLGSIYAVWQPENMQNSVLNALNGADSWILALYIASGRAVKRENGVSSSDRMDKNVCS